MSSEKANLSVKLSPAQQEKETEWEDSQEILDTAPEQKETGKRLPCKFLEACSGRQHDFRAAKALLLGLFLLPQTIRVDASLCLEGPVSHL